MEYWAREATLRAVDDWALLRWSMCQYQHGCWGSHVVKANPRSWLMTLWPLSVRFGPVPWRSIEAYLAAASRSATGSWWNRSGTKWSDTKWVVEPCLLPGCYSQLLEWA